jgi:hypothetical protein
LSIVRFYWFGSKVDGFLLVGQSAALTDPRGALIERERRHSRAAFPKAPSRIHKVKVS